MPDTSSETSSALDTNQAAALFANILDPQPEPVEQKSEEPAKPAEPEKAEEAKPEETEAVEESTDDAPKTFTIKVDGKDVEVSAAEMEEAYKSGLRQADYTKKTMETAEQRKAAEAEVTKAREERQQAAHALSQAQAVLQAQLQEQSQIDWQTLLETDPVEYLKQQHLAQNRQARLQQIGQEQQQLLVKEQAERAEQMKSHVQRQQEELLAKLPEWKDESVAKAERVKLREYLQSQGFEQTALDSITDHRAVLLGRKAMLYDQMMSKAQAAAKKVSTLPQKMERPGSGESQTLDKRGQAFQRLSKSGRVEDAAAIFSQIL